VRTALDSNPDIDAVGNTDTGLLWRFAGGTGSAPGAQMPSSAAEPLLFLIVGGQALVVILTLLLAIPTGAPRSDIRPKRKPSVVVGAGVGAGVGVGAAVDTAAAPFGTGDPLAGESDDEQN
jgi:hypothetical protein